MFIINHQNSCLKKKNLTESMQQFLTNPSFGITKINIKTINLAFLKIIYQLIIVFCELQFSTECKTFETETFFDERSYHFWTKSSDEV